MSRIELWRVPLLLFAFGSAGFVCFGLLLRYLKRDEPHPLLDRLAGLAPVRGRWLRFLLMAVVIPLFAASIVAL